MGSGTRAWEPLDVQPENECPPRAAFDYPGHISTKWQGFTKVYWKGLADMLLNHLDGILSYCWTKVPLGVVEAENDNIKALLRRIRGYCNLNYLLLKRIGWGLKNSTRRLPEGRVK